MAPFVVDLSASNPFRPVDWRHRLAAERVASGRVFPRLWDPATLEIASYLRRAEALPSPAAWRRSSPASIWRTPFIGTPIRGSASRSRHDC